MTGLVRAMRYLTIIPVPGHPARPGTRDELEELGRAVAWFPLVGLGIGLGLTVLDLITARLFPPLLAGLLTIAAWKLVTGGLHLDGLADCLDGLGGRDPAHRLAIMRDSRIGAFAAVGLILVLFVDVAALAEIADPWRWRALVIAPVVGRAALPLVARLLAPARTDGQGARFQSGVGRGTAACAVGLALVIAAVALGVPGLVACVVGLSAAALMASWFASRLGGVTGDALGAAVEIAELAVLLVVAAWTHVRP